MKWTWEKAHLPKLPDKAKILKIILIFTSEIINQIKTCYKPTNSHITWKIHLLPPTIVGTKTTWKLLSARPCKRDKSFTPRVKIINTRRGFVQQKGCENPRTKMHDEKTAIDLKVQNQAQSYSSGQNARRDMVAIRLLTPTPMLKC